MNIEYIKVGETYNLELLCIHNKGKVIVFETPTGDHIPLRNSDIECVSPANGTPVAELEPYIISEGAGIIELYNEQLDVVKAWFYNDVKAGVKALALAEAERDRLNAEWRQTPTETKTPFDN